MKPTTNHISRRSVIGAMAAGAALALPGRALAHGATVHLFGDSIFHGWALGMFPEQAPTTHPLYGLRSIWSTANLILAENGAPASFSYVTSNLVFPDHLEKLAAHVENGLIKSGDWVVFEDGGPHGSNPDVYQGWQADYRAALAGTDVRLAFLTMFDYPPAPADSQYDLKIRGKSINDVTRATASGAGALLLDMNLYMDSWRNGAASQDGVAVMHPDGIHPNVWGQLRMTGLILKAVGLTPFLLSLEPARRIVANAWQSLAYGGSNWSPQRANSYLEYCLRLT